MSLKPSGSKANTGIVSILKELKPLIKCKRVKSDVVVQVDNEEPFSISNVVKNQNPTWMERMVIAAIAFPIGEPDQLRYFMIPQEMHPKTLDIAYALCEKGSNLPALSALGELQRKNLEDDGSKYELRKAKFYDPENFYGFSMSTTVFNPRYKAIMEIFSKMRGLDVGDNMLSSTTGLGPSAEVFQSFINSVVSDFTEGTRMLEMDIGQWYAMRSVQWACDLFANPKTKRFAQAQQAINSHVWQHCNLGEVKGDACNDGILNIFSSKYWKNSRTGESLKVDDNKRDQKKDERKKKLEDLTEKEKSKLTRQERARWQDEWKKTNFQISSQEYSFDINEFQAIEKRRYYKAKDKTLTEKKEERAAKIKEKESSGTTMWMPTLCRSRNGEVATIIQTGKDKIFMTDLLNVQYITTTTRAANKTIAVGSNRVAIYNKYKKQPWIGNGLYKEELVANDFYF
jgi:hypothetical protein